MKLRFVILLPGGYQTAINSTLGKYLPKVTFVNRE